MVVVLLLELEQALALALVQLVDGVLRPRLEVWRLLGLLLLLAPLARVLLELVKVLLQALLLLLLQKLLQSDIPLLHVLHDARRRRARRASVVRPQRGLPLPVLPVRQGSAEDMASLSRSLLHHRFAAKARLLSLLIVYP